VKRPKTLMEQVIFLEDGTYKFPKEWNRKKRRRVARKINKKKKAGFVFPVTK